MEPTNDNDKINVIVRVRPTLRNEDKTNFVEIMDVIFFYLMGKKKKLKNTSNTKMKKRRKK